MVLCRAVAVNGIMQVGDVARIGEYFYYINEEVVQGPP